MVGIGMAPIVGRLIDGLVPWMAAFVGIIIIVVSQVIQTFAGELSVGAIVIAIISSYSFCLVPPLSLNLACNGSVGSRYSRNPSSFDDRNI
jgi:hypothetical protein